MRPRYHLFLFICFISLFTAKGELSYPYYFTNDSDFTAKGNNVQFLHSGVAALQKRIDLIRKAKERISLEYYIWKKDRAGLLVFHELIKKAREGVKVKIILDKSIAAIEMDEFFAEALRKYDIHIHHYNRAIDPVTAQFRTHRKLLVIDGEEAIVGGRNIGEEYFSMADDYNFLDRDLYLSGPVAKAIQDSFEAYWRNPIVKKAERLESNPVSNRIVRDRNERLRLHRIREEKFSRLRKEATNWVEQHSQMESVAEELERMARPILDRSPVYSCPRLTFVSDRPGADIRILGSRSDYVERYRLTRRVLFNFIKRKAQKEFVMASPYFMLNEDWQGLLSELLAKDVELELFTNSLNSTDSVIVAATFYPTIYAWQKHGLSAYLHNSKYRQIYPALNPLARKGLWGMHEKTMVFNDESFFIGTYNIDNRSDFLNSEMGVICEDAPVVRDNLLQDMRRRSDYGIFVQGVDKAINVYGAEVDIFGGASQDRIDHMNFLKNVVKILEPLL